MDRAPNATSGIIFNEARLQKNGINPTQSFHCDNSFDQKYEHGNKDLCMEWSRKCMMTNMKAVLLTDESRALPNDPDCLTKGWIFNGDNCSVGISCQQSDLVRGGSRDDQSDHATKVKIGQKIGKLKCQSGCRASRSLWH